MGERPTAAAGATDGPILPPVVDRATFDRQLDELRAREKAHTREGDAIAAARRRLPMVEVAADRVFETYWTKRRGAEAVDDSDALMDLTVFGRQEDWEDSPAGWPRLGHATRTLGGAPDWPPLGEWPGGRPTAQWPRLDAGFSESGHHRRRRRPRSGSLPLRSLDVSPGMCRSARRPFVDVMRTGTVPGPETQETP